MPCDIRTSQPGTHNFNWMYRTQKYEHSKEPAEDLSPK